MWRDANNKAIDTPGINFAGKYMIIPHSCGTGCRYYTMTDLSDGRDLATLSPFTSAEPQPTTREGYPYVTNLVYTKESHMLVAQYHLTTPTGNECRERVFKFQDEKLIPVTKTRLMCGLY
jgi:hypothetical protein